MVIYHVTRFTRHCLFGLLVFLAIAISLLRISLSIVENYKADLQDKIQSLTTIPLEIGKLGANMRGFSPEIILKDIHVKVIGKQGKPAIKLAEVRLGINLLDLLINRDMLASSWLTLVGAELSIIRKADGSLSIAGLQANETERPLWLLQTGRYEVLKSNINWLDQQQDAAPVIFKNVNFLIRNAADGLHHEIHFVSQLPESYGKQLRLSMSIQGSISSFDEINGTVYAEGKQVNLFRFIPAGSLPGIKTTKGACDFKLWTEWNRSTLMSWAGRVQSNKFEFIQENNTRYKIKRLDSKFYGLKKKEGWAIGLKQFNLITPQKKWPTTDLSVWVDPSFKLIAGNITKLQLQQASELMQYFAPFNKERQHFLEALSFKGQLNKFNFFVDNKNKEYAVDGEFKHISVNAYAGVPQLENISGTISGSHRQGVINFQSSQGKLFFPKLFRTAIQLNTLKGQVSWLHQHDLWQLFSKKLIVDTQDLSMENRLSIRISDQDKPTFMDLQSSFSSENISRAANYYPSSIMDADVLDWLDHAFISGKIKSGKLLVYGDLDKFPFTQGEGVFEVLYNMDNVELNFSPEWPRLKKVAADIRFYNNGVSMDILHAEANDLTLKQASISIPSFTKSNYLRVQGQAQGSIINSLKYLQKSPLHHLVDQVLQVITPKGLTHVALDMKIPLTEKNTAKVKGVAFFNQAALKIKTLGLDVTQINGNLKFTEKGLFADQIRARALAKTIAVKVNSDDLATWIDINGAASISALQKVFSFFKQPLLKKKILGWLPYHIKLHIPDKEDKPVQLTLQSDLKGIKLALPGLLKKSANQEKSFALHLAIDNAPYSLLNLNYNDTLKAVFRLNTTQAELDAADIIYGNGVAVLPAKPGFDVHLHQDVFDLSEWMDFIGLANPSSETPRPSLRHLSLQTQQLKWKNISYGAIDISAQRLKNQWRGELVSHFAKGEVVLQSNESGKNKITLDLDSLNLSALSHIPIPVENQKIKNLPLFDLKSRHLWWNHVDLGHLDIVTEPLGDGLRFKQIKLIAKNHQLELKGNWIHNPTGSVTEMTGILSANDFGAFLSDMGFANDIKESRGKVEYSGSWPGVPQQISLENMNAELTIELKNGRISSIEPGFGRLLGFLAMDQWIKRITLDFSDLYKKGLSFNRISGHFNIAEGKAVTDDLLVDAIPARITITGLADLVNKTLDNQVLVVPKSASAVPIAGTIVGRIAGTITQAVTNDYEEGYFFGSHYKVTGPWKKMEVTPLSEQNGIFNKSWQGLKDFLMMEPDVE